MARGKMSYWEMTFDPQGKDPTVEKRLTELDHLSGFEEAKVIIESPSVGKRLNLRARFLCGNHDWALRQYISHNMFEPFALIGGLSTLSSYL
jgi:hypothetical protein